MIPFKKELIIAVVSIALVAGFAKYWYDRGFTAADKTAQLAALTASNENMQRELLAVTSSIEVVTVYKDKIIEIEKKVPVYVKTVEEIFSYDDSIVVPDSLAGLHKDIVCQTNGDAESACVASGAATENVTLGEFSRTVVKNYGVCAANSAQLASLIDWVTEQEKIINVKEK